MSKTMATYIRTGNDTFLRGQAMRIREYCEEKGYTIADSVDVVGDRNLGFQMLVKMLDGAKEKGIETVVMDSTNRIAGSVVEMLEVQRTVEEAGVTIETLDGSHELTGVLAAFSVLDEAAYSDECSLDENVEQVFGYDITEDGLEVNEAEAEVVKFVFDRTQEYSANPPEDLVQAVVDEFAALGKQLTPAEAAKRVPLRDIIQRVEDEAKMQWPEQHEAMVRKQVHNKNLAARRALNIEPIVDRETWDAVHERMAENHKDSGPQMGGMGM